MDILCHALESYTARWYADFDAKQPEQRVPYCGANPIADMWSEKAMSAARRRVPRRGATTARDTAAREQMAMAATFAGLGFGNAGVHIPHANAYPIAGRVRDYRPEGYPDDEPIVPHGMAVSLTAPEAFRFTFDAAPERHLHAARLLDPTATATGPDALPDVLTALMRDIGIPNGLAEVGLRRGRRRRPGRRRRSSSSGCWRPRRRRPRTRTWRRCSSRRWNTGEVTPAPQTWSRSCGSRGVTDVDDSTLTRALYSSDASLYRVVPQVVVRPRAADELDAILDVAQATGAPVTMRGAGTSIAGNAVGTGIVVDTAQAPQPGRLDRPRGAYGGRPARRRARRPAARGGAARAAVRAGPVDAHPLHDRRDDRQQRLRLAGARLRPDRRQRGGPGRRVGARRAARRRGAARRAGRPAPRAHPHRVRPVRPAGQRLLARAPAAGERPQRRPVPGRLRGHPRAWSARPPCGWSRTPPTGSWSCSATRRWSRRPTPCPRCSRRPAAAMIACEGLDARIVDLVRGAGGAVPELPRGAGWLFVEVAGAEAPALAAKVVAEGGALGHRLVPDARRGGRALADPRGRRRPGRPEPVDARRTPAGRTPPCRPDRLGAWLRDFDELLTEHDLDGVPYGHFGDGCVHVRIDFPFQPGEPARRRSSATSSPPARSSCATTAARCPASTATAGPAPSCCR